LLLILAVAAGPASSAKGGGGSRGDGMQGPDFILGQIVDWRVPPNGPARLTLADGSNWSIAITDPLFASAHQMIDLAFARKGPIFLSGDHRSGRVEDVALPRRLRPESVARVLVQGHLPVTFVALPSLYYLATDRPWFAQARDLLLRTIALKTPAEFPPELLVTIDIVTMEVMDVRQP
jgi:hypothetical protein